LNLEHFDSFTFILCFVWRIVFTCLVVLQMVGAIWCATMRIVVGVGDLVQRTEDGRTYQVLGGRTIERSGDAVCGLHHTNGDEERGFLC
jgi:hypothetical protein